MSKTPETGALTTPEAGAASRLEVMALACVMDPRNKDAILGGARTIRSLEARLAEANARIALLEETLRVYDAMAMSPALRCAGDK